MIEGKRPSVLDEHKPKLPQGWDDYLCKGFTHGLEEKALSASSDPDGGYLAPAVLADRITSVARDRSSIRAIANVVSITGNQYEIPQDPNDLDADWVGETASWPETTTPQLNKLVIPVHEIYAMPKATQTILDDASFNVEEWLAGHVRDIFDRKENTAFVSGDGVSKPRGFLSYPTVAEASWSWGYVWQESVIAGQPPCSWVTLWPLAISAGLHHC